jgi:hypothetical protein
VTLQPVAATPIDAELWWITYLRASLTGRTEPYATGVYFDRRVPTTRRDRMVIVRRDGGFVRGLFDFPRVSLDVWAKTEQDATNLAALMVGLALGAPLDSDVVSVTHISGPNDVADPSGQPRRQSLIEAKHRAVSLA